MAGALLLSVAIVAERYGTEALIGFGPIVLVIAIFWLIKSRVKRVDDDRAQSDPFLTLLGLLAILVFVAIIAGATTLTLVDLSVILLLIALAGFVISVPSTFKPPEEESNE